MQDDFDYEQWLHDNEPEIKAYRIKQHEDRWRRSNEAMKADIEFARKPWWVQQQEVGDYHYGRYDMDWNDNKGEENE